MSTNTTPLDERFAVNGVTDQAQSFRPAIGRNGNDNDMYDDLPPPTRSTCHGQTFAIGPHFPPGHQGCHGWVITQLQNVQVLDKAGHDPGAPAAYTCLAPGRTLMPPRSACLSPDQLVYRIFTLFNNDVNMAKVVHYRSWIHKTIAPKLNQSGGYKVSVFEMEALLAFFGELVFSSPLSGTRFSWKNGLERNHGSVGCTSLHGRLIMMDPNPVVDTGSVAAEGLTRADFMLSVLLHECCHAIFYHQCCRDECGNHRCGSTFLVQIGPIGGHGRAWIRMARMAEAIVRKHGLFRAKLAHERYI